MAENDDTAKLSYNVMISVPKKYKQITNAHFRAVVKYLEQEIGGIKTKVTLNKGGKPKQPGIVSKVISAVKGDK